ncbi:hypothetical protein [Chitinophaga sp. sic0106]|nr:hypothetical protein [Chitinophaga sp. sic0106]MBV7531507.1 hypothetical protein [Chitinophaga sp. sic0106]
MQFDLPVKVNGFLFQSNFLRMGFNSITFGFAGTGAALRAENNKEDT